MPKYLIEMHDGRKFQVEADSQPSEADVLAKLGESAAPSPAVAAPVDRGGLAHPLTSVVAPELEAARGLLPAPVEQPIMARSRTGALYPSAIGTGAKTIAKAAGDVAIDQAEGATSPVALAAAGAGKIASSLAQSPLARKAAGKLLQFIGDFDLRKPLQSTVGRAGDALVSSVEKGDVSLPGYPRTGTTPALPVAPSGPVSPHLDLTQQVQAGSLTQEQLAERFAAVHKQGGLSADARAQFEAAKAARHGPVGVTVQPPAAMPMASPAPASPAAAASGPVVATPAPAAPPMKMSDRLNLFMRTARQAGVTLSPDDYLALNKAVTAGADPQAVIASLVAERNPAAAFAAKFPGTLTDAEAQAALDDLYTRGKAKTPSAQTAKARRAGATP